MRHPCMEGLWQWAAFAYIVEMDIKASRLDGDPKQVAMSMDPEWAHGTAA